MDEYFIYNAALDIEKPIFGYSFQDACRRYGIDPNEWELTMVNYIEEEA